MKRILVVEDTLALAKELSDILKMEGYDVVVMAAAPLALDFLQSAKPDLIITDLLMKDVDGFEFISAVRLMPACNETPIIILSASASEEARRKGEERGANLFIKKPCDIQHLIKAVRGLI